MLVSVPTLKNVTCRRSFCPVPPSPGLIQELYARWKGLIEAKRLPPHITFEQFFAIWSSTRRSENYIGLDDGETRHAPSTEEAQLIDRPATRLRGVIRTLVLLVDFEDQPHSAARTQSYYQQMLFGDLDVFPTGSMAEYYRRISNFNRENIDYDLNGTDVGIDIQGEVFGWFRMPQPSTYYTNGESGMGIFPRNVQGLAVDAVAEAVAQGVDFGGYDVLGEGIVTALFIIHAGSGAERTGARDDFWSLKWAIPGNGTETNDPSLRVRTFLTVPEDCQMGVCAHEWGHLAARWADFYDTGKQQLLKSSGLGSYCLMASGTWNNGGITPGLPNGMLRMFHGWIQPMVVTRSQNNIQLKPAAEGGSIVMIKNPTRMPRPEQYVFVEYRRRHGQDTFLPDEGVAIYMVDESIDTVNDEANLAIELIQADNRRDLAQVFGMGNQGDEHDLYPGKVKGKVRRSIGRNTKPSLALANGTWTGITIKVRGTPGAPTMGIDVTITP